MFGFQSSSLNYLLRIITTKLATNNVANWIFFKSMYYKIVDIYCFSKIFNLNAKGYHNYDKTIKYYDD